MRSVVLHVDGAGKSWFIASCRHCNQVHKYPVADVYAGQVACRSCHSKMELRGAEMLGSTRDADGNLSRVSSGDGMSNAAG